MIHRSSAPRRRWPQSRIAVHLVNSPTVAKVIAGTAPRSRAVVDAWDYLHVDDAAEAFVAAVRHCPEVGRFRRYNVGSGTGTSVLDVVVAVERVTGRSVPVEHRPAVAEPRTLVRDPGLAVTESGWQPRRSGLDAIVASALAARQAGE